MYNDSRKVVDSMEQEKIKRNRSSDWILVSLAVLGVVLIFIIVKSIVGGLNKEDDYYTLTFDSNGGSKVNNMVAPEGLINLPTNLEKNGYRFMGWIINNELAENPYYVKENSSFIANWHSDSTVYKVNLHLDGGTGNDTILSTSNVLSSLYEPTKDGYIFNGWYTEDNKLVTFPSKLNLTNDFYAKWIDSNTEYVTVKFDTTDEVVSYKIQKDTVLVPPISPYRLGFEFISWNLNGKEYDFTKPVTEDITLKAKWREKEIKYYVVSFDVNGSKDHIISQMVLEGENALVPVAPEKEGYQFAGWELDGTKYDFNSVVTKDIKLKAQWKTIEADAKKYIVSFNLNGGDGDIKTQYVLEGGVATVPSITPTKKGYTFGGWYYNNELYDFNSVLTSDITIDAQWYANESIYYSVTFDLNGGGTNYSKQVISGEKVSKPSNPTRKGYTFNGWYYNGKKYDFNKEVNENIVLIANWKKNEEKNVEPEIDDSKNEIIEESREENKKEEPGNDVVVETPKEEEVKYKITFNFNGGGENYSVDVTAGAKVSQPTNPVRSGYVFEGWYYNGSAYDFGTAVTKDMTLFAQWRKKATYKVTFNTNNGSVTTQNVIEGNKAAKPDNPTKVGYSFLGWYTNQKLQYDFTKPVTKDMTLYALWGPGTSSSSNGTTWIYVNTPTNLNKESYLADKDKGNNLIYKTSFKGNVEFFYSHKLSSPLTGKARYLMRFYNPGDEEVTLTINGCGAYVGTDASAVWNQFNNNSCSIAGKSYKISGNSSLLLFQNNNSFLVRSSMDQGGVNTLSGNIEGVVNMTSTGNLLVASMVFYQLDQTYEAVYNG